MLPITPKQIKTMEIPRIENAHWESTEQAQHRGRTAASEHEIKQSFFSRPKPREHASPPRKFTMPHIFWGSRDSPSISVCFLGALAPEVSIRPLESLFLARPSNQASVGESIAARPCRTTATRKAPILILGRGFPFIYYASTSHDIPPSAVAAWLSRAKLGPRGGGRHLATSTWTLPCHALLRFYRIQTE